jgi:hypothetical protein
MSRAIGEASPRGGQQPGFRLVGHAHARPRVQGGGKGVAERVFRGRHVTRPHCEVGEQPAVGIPGGKLGRPPRAKVGAGGLAHMGRWGLISTAPLDAAGQRPAQSRA